MILTYVTDIALCAFVEINEVMFSADDLLSRPPPRTEP